MPLLKQLAGLLSAIALSAYIAAANRPSPSDGDGGALEVWSGRAPRGKTWQNLGAGGGVIAVPARDSAAEAGLLARFTASGFRSFGLNWKGWYPADAADDCRAFTHLQFKVRLLVNRHPNADLTVRLVDNLGGQDRQSGNAVPLVAGGYAPKLDAAWRGVAIPLDRFAAYRNLRLDRLWEVVFANDNLGEQLFQFDEIAFVCRPEETAAAAPASSQREALLERAELLQMKSSAAPPETNLRPEPAPVPPQPQADTSFVRPEPNVSGSASVARPDSAAAKARPAPEFTGYSARGRLLTERDGWPIREAIYGVADMPRDRRQAYGLAISRQGGNTVSRYNWRINADSGAADWYFKNRSKTPGRESAYGQHLEENLGIGAGSYICLPMLGWVAKDTGSYAFPVSVHGPQKGTEPNHPDIGNGQRPDGSPITRADPNATSIPFGPEDVAAGVADALRKLDRTAKRAPRYWVLDNEPMLWHETHRDLHPQPATYDELWTKTVAHAEAIRRADPEAKIAGFCSWGWSDLFYSAADKGNDHYATAPDRRDHGGLPLAEWFLAKCAQYKATYGHPLIDVLDVHWYPQATADGQTPTNGKGPGLNALRLRTTRDLWDADYVPESWVRNAGDRKPVALIPRMKALIEKRCPGMELCLGEYCFGGGENITGGLAQAELFGTFAREKLDLAFFWQQPEGSQYAAWELFRNYDGRGARFGSRYLPVECDHPQCSAFAARRDDGALTLVLINKTLHTPCKAQFDLPGTNGVGKLYRFDDASRGRIAQQPDMAVNGKLDLTLPAASATLIEIK